MGAVKHSHFTSFVKSRKFAATALSRGHAEHSASTSTRSNQDPLDNSIAYITTTAIAVSSTELKEIARHHILITEQANRI